VARGALVAQFESESRKNALGLRISDRAQARLKEAFDNERKSPKTSSLTETELAARLLNYGLTLYFAREAAGPSRFYAALAVFDGDEEKAFAEILRRGFESLEAEQGKKKPSR
jgi:hypothetical protein